MDDIVTRLRNHAEDEAMLGNDWLRDVMRGGADEIERLRAEVSTLMDGMEAAWGLLANGQYWDTTDKVRHLKWEDYRDKWRDDHWHPALDRDREARRG